MRSKFIWNVVTQTHEKILLERCDEGVHLVGRGAVGQQGESLAQHGARRQPLTPAARVDLGVRGQLSLGSGVSTLFVAWGKGSPPSRGQGSTLIRGQGQHSLRIRGQLSLIWCT